MWVHFALFVPILICGALLHIQGFDINTKKLCYTVTFSLLFLIAAFRSINVGNDTAEYAMIYTGINESTSFIDALRHTRYEPGFVLLYYILSRFHLNFTWVLIIVTFFYLASVYIFINKYAKDTGLAIVLFFTYAGYYHIYNQIRECLAGAIFLFGVSLLIKRKYLGYFVLCTVAMTFHTSAIILFIVAFIPHIGLQSENEKLKFWILLFGAIIGFECVLNYVLKVIPQYQHYLVSYGIGEAKLASLGTVVIYCTPFVCFYFFKAYMYRHIEVTDSILDKLMLIECIISICSLQFNLMDRFLIYFQLPFIVSMSRLVYGFEKPNKTTAFVILTCISFVYLTLTLLLRSNWYGIFPYSFV